MSDHPTEPLHGASSTEPLHGAIIQSTYVTRDITVYGIQEQEVESLATLNTQTSLCFSAASSFMTFGLGIGVNAVFADTLTPVAKIVLKLVMPICCVIAVIFAVMGWYARKRGNDTWSRIKSQSRGGL